MRRFYEELWRRHPETEAAPDGRAARAHLRDHLPPTGRVLDLGCGAGRWFEELSAGGAREVVGADVAEAALDRARGRHPGVELHRVPFEGPLPFPRDGFDAIWCAETLEHVADTEGFLSEARRVLRPGAPLVLTVPDHGRVRTALIALTRFERHFHPLGDHLRFYTRRSLADVLDDAGFADTTIRRHRAQLLACGS